MLTHQIALVSKTRHIKTSDLTKVAAALQKQATRDLGPLWNIQIYRQQWMRLNF